MEIKIRPNEMAGGRSSADGGSGPTEGEGPPGPEQKGRPRNSNMGTPYVLVVDLVAESAARERRMKCR